MESKKINQLATELAPDLSDLTIIGDPTTGISKKITLSQMASLFTGTVEEYATLAAFPLVGVADTIYIALDTNIIYRYDTSLSAYVILSPNIINSLVFSDANGFDGTITLVGSVATLSITTALTLGSVPFIGASGALIQDNANLFFDDTNNRLGIATASPTTPLDVFGSGIIGLLNATSTNNAYLGFASNGTNKWSAGNVQSDHRFRIFSEANSAELITILQTGEFGIGIANPLTKFHIDGGASALIANLDANVSVAKSISFRSDNSNRINLEVSGTESGSNVGMDFFIRRYSDAGALIYTPLTITRSTGAISLATTLNLSEIQASTSAGITLKSNGGTSIALFGAGGGAGTTLYGGLIGTSASFSSTLTASAFIPSAATIPANGMYLSAANTLDFSTNTTNRLSISSTGVASFSGLIISTTLGQILQASSATTGNLYQYFKNTTGEMYFGIENSTGASLATGSSAYATVLSSQSATSLQFGTSGIIRATISATGLTTFSAFGTHNFSSGGTGYNKLGIRNTTAGAANGAQLSIGTNADPDQFYVQSFATTFTTSGMNIAGGAVVNGEGPGGLSLAATQSNIQFYTNGAGSANERMRITSGGAVCIGTTTATNSGLLEMAGSTTVYNLISLKDTGTASSSVYYITFFNSSNGFAGGVQHTTASTVTYYTGPSDQRLKSNIKDVEESVLPLFNDIKLKTYNHIADEDESVVYKGFLAQDMVDNFPEAYGKDKEGYYMYNPTGYIPYLVKAIQELSSKNEELSNRLIKLESK